MIGATPTFFLFANLFFSIVSVGDGIPARSQNPSGCLSYEPSVVELTGTLVRKTFADAQGNPETYWLVELSRPICVNKNPQKEDLNDAQNDVRSLQLVFPDRKMYLRYKNLVGKKVTAKGTLFAGISAHHHTPVLLTTTMLRIAVD
jgi:hypothetical protein